jgi:hypothetical protein
MAEVHLTPVPNTTVVFHQPGQHPLAPGAGQPIVATGSVLNKTAAVHGQVNAGGPIPGPTFHNPA